MNRKIKRHDLGVVRQALRHPKGGIPRLLVNGHQRRWLCFGRIAAVTRLPQSGSTPNRPTPGRDETAGTVHLGSNTRRYWESLKRR